MLWLSPPCATWLNFISRRSHGRSWENVLGAEEKAKVTQANRTATYISWLIVLAEAMGVYVAVEQPLASMLYRHPCMFQVLLAVSADRYVTSLGAFGAPTQKPLELYTTLPRDVCMRHLVRRGKRPRAGAQSTQLCLKRGRWVIANGDALSRSEIYPKGFARAIAATVAHVRDEVTPPIGARKTCRGSRVAR